jgi:hypothetical protein
VAWMPTPGREWKAVSRAVTVTVDSADRWQLSSLQLRRHCGRMRPPTDSQADASSPSPPTAASSKSACRLWKHVPFC